ncbi:MAG: PpiC-type peptidyl-prolyl cis-trans isomerase [Candidatus Moranbacteria bacterium GW2011_GWD2_38_7]|nr:MAG: PpiC-type peptidyl-prolyl cis-trans isomerase [Candidatus Moranbacteria bacterium GW2011_GWD2_38_7]
MKKKTKIVTLDGEKAIRVSFATAVYAFLILLVVIIGIGSILAYGTHTEIGEKIAAKIAKVVPFPAAIVDWNHIVYINGVENNVNSVRQFYQTQSFSNDGLRVDFSTEIGKKRLEIKKREVLDKMVEDKIVEILAKKRGIEISEADVDLAVSAKLNEFGTAEQVKADLLKSYGWEVEDFKQLVVLPSMYTQALSQQILREQKSDAQAQSKIEKAQTDLKGGADFNEIVEKYSEGFSKENKGELGWVRKEQVIPELANSIFGTSVPEKNTIVESPIGFHIVEIENKKKEDGEDVLQLRQIFVAKNTFADWLETQKKQISVWVPMNEFGWNKNLGMIEFTDNEMKEFEKKQRSDAQGDASLMF